MNQEVNELELLKSIENNEWKSVKNFKSIKLDSKNSAKNTLLGEKMIENPLKLNQEKID